MPPRSSPEKDFVARVTRRIAEVRNAKGVTQEELAALIGTAPRAYQRIEAGQNVTLRTIARIAAALNVSPEDLVSGQASLSLATPKPRRAKPPRN